MLISGVQQSGSVTHISILFHILSHTGYHRILGRFSVLLSKSLLITADSLVHLLFLYVL